MTKLSRIDAGQPVLLRPEARDFPADKWALLDALTQAAENFGLTHRSLNVLRALLSFFPDRDLPRTAGAGVVYPSNRVLSDRLNGMPESTLRRHLSTLVKSGLVVRHDSANRKRFARFGGVAFGFDLSPLARSAAEVFDAAEEAVQRRAHVSALRARIAAARQRLLDDGCPSDDPMIENARLSLRRKLSTDSLETLADAVEDRLTIVAPAKEMSATPHQNERHIQDTDKSISVSKNAPVTVSQPSEAPALSDVLDSCHEYQALFPTPAPDWPALHTVASRLHGMMGIDQQVYVDAKRRMGAERATTAVLCILEMLGSVKSPGAYLRALSARSESGLFNMQGMLKAAKTAKLSADNFV
ncbi:replication initiation protein RepC [Sagittula marina]|uniref:Replication initiation protein RepC n=1 Tax=Sagittula marina TaxID=943940 RepID=A0A7W6DT00_9RHOB|nr:plasmid replication protein RepC [Sagittula marina]MBB3987146.1 replication initiation protein RepC [Sagittula marina]